MGENSAARGGLFVGRGVGNGVTGNVAVTAGDLGGVLVAVTPDVAAAASAVC